MAVLALVLAYAGFLALALAMDRHAAEMGQARRVPPGRRQVLRIAGSIVLALSLWASIAAWGAPFGILGWLGALTAGAIVLVLVLAVRPHLALPLAIPLLVCGGLAAALFG
jgi:hypothetical protein